MMPIISYGVDTKQRYGGEFLKTNEDVDPRVVHRYIKFDLQSSFYRPQISKTQTNIHKVQNHYGKKHEKSTGSHDFMLRQYFFPPIAKFTSTGRLFAFHYMHCINGECFSDYMF